MDTPPQDASRTVVCLISEPDATERCPSLLKYLQLGLVERQMETLRVVLQGESLHTLQTGTSVVLEDRPLAWPLGRWARRSFIANIVQKLESLQKGSPAVVHAFGPKSADLAAEIAGETGAEMVLTLSCAGSALTEGMRRYAGKAAALFATSEAIRTDASAAWSASREIACIPVGLPVLERASAFGTPERTPVLVHAGPLVEGARVDLLLRTLKVVLTRFGEALLFLVGKGPAEDALRRMAQSLDVSGAVMFIGKLENWQTILEAADICCVPAGLPAWREEPLAALASGVCVVAAHGGLCDELIDRRTALLFPAEDEAGLTDRVIELLENPTAARRLALAGQEHIRAHNSPTAMIDKYVDAYRSLTRKHQTIPFP